MDPSLLRALFFMYGWVLLGLGIFKLIYNLLTFVSPQILKYVGFREESFCISVFALFVRVCVLTLNFFHDMHSQPCSPEKQKRIEMPKMIN